MEDGSNGAVEVWSGYRVGPSAAGNNAPVCQQCRLDDCLSQCYSDDSCHGVDYDVNGTLCYTLNATLACSSLTPVSQFIHVSTAHCGNRILIHSVCATLSLQTFDVVTAIQLHFDEIFTTPLQRN